MFNDKFENTKRNIFAIKVTFEIISFRPIKGKAFMKSCTQKTDKNFRLLNEEKSWKTQVGRLIADY
jgi:hypothetical protein